MRATRLARGLPPSLGEAPPRRQPRQADGITSSPHPDRPRPGGEGDREHLLAARDFLPYLVLALCCLILFRDGFFEGTVFYERDTELFYEPLGRWFAEQLKGGRMPLWMPLIFGGYPLFADGEIGMLYPPHLLLLPLVPTQVWLTVTRALHLFLAGAFTLGFLRLLGLGPWGALVGGLVFALGSFFITQIQHENLVRSAVWLPLVLLLVELAFRRTGWARQQWLVGAGLALAVAALGVHVQPVAMTLLALGLYTTYRILVGPLAGPRRERALLLVWAPGLVALIGLAGAAVQWLPLFELGRTSYRGPGLAYDLATAWPLRWQNLATVVFPYLFRMEDGRYLMLWQQWESFLYVGIAPLGLALLAVLFARRRIVPFFVLLGLFGLLVGLAEQSPLNLHRLLWSFPGFSSLRAPGRFAYLVVFAAAGLAAIGFDWLTRRRRRGRSGALAGCAILLSAGGLLWLVLGFRARLLADPVRWKKLIDDTYIATRHEFGWLEGVMLYEHLIAALELSQPKTALSIALLALTGLLVAAWSWWPRPAGVWGILLTALIAGDLLVFGYDFHPRAPLADLVRPAAVTTFLASEGLAQQGDGGRVFVDSAIRALEPNRLLYADVPTVSGYSSLQSQRHFEYWSSVDRQKDVLLDLWNVGYLVTTDPPTDVEIVDGTAYRPYHPLFNGSAANLTGLSRFVVEPFPTAEVRVLATMVNGVHVEQGAAVADLELVGPDGARRLLTLRAGLDIAENAYERPNVEPLVRHFRAPLAGTVPDTDPSGAQARANLYRARFPIDPLDVARVEIRHRQPLGQTRVYGLGLVDATGRVRSLFSTDREKFRPIFRDGRLGVFENGAAFPRAYVVPEAIARRSRAEESVLTRMAARPFDAARQVFLEDGPFEGLPLVDSVFGQTLQPGAAPAPARVTDLSTDHVRVETPAGPGGYLVLADAYHRGWRARIDGAETPVYLANFLFRAIHLPPGPHTVDFVFDPLSLRLGRAITLATLLFAFTILAGPCVWAYLGGFPGRATRQRRRSPVAGSA